MLCYGLKLFPSQTIHLLCGNALMTNYPNDNGENAVQGNKGCSCAGLVRLWARHFRQRTDNLNYCKLVRCKTRRKKRCCWIKSRDSENSCFKTVPRTRNFFTSIKMHPLKRKLSEMPMRVHNFRPQNRLRKLAKKPPQISRRWHLPLTKTITDCVYNVSCRTI